jgi:hypothetical protein
MAVMAASGKYLGTNTSFMHIAAALQNDSFVYWWSGFKAFDEWAYPQNKHFNETEPIDAIIERIKKEWL